MRGQIILTMGMSCGTVRRLHHVVLYTKEVAMLEPAVQQFRAFLMSIPTTSDLMGLVIEAGLPLVDKLYRGNIVVNRGGKRVSEPLTLTSVCDTSATRTFADAMMSALGAKTCCTFRSISQPFSGEEVRVAGSVPALNQTFARTIRLSRDRRWKEIKQDIGSGRRMELLRRHADLQKQLDQLFPLALGGNTLFPGDGRLARTVTSLTEQRFPAAVVDITQRNLSVLMFTFFVAAVHNDRETVERFEPLVQQLPRYLPYCQNGRGEWVVFGA